MRWGGKRTDAGLVKLEGAPLGDEVGEEAEVGRDHLPVPAALHEVGGGEARVRELGGVGESVDGKGEVPRRRRQGLPEPAGQTGSYFCSESEEAKWAL